MGRPRLKGERLPNLSVVTEDPTTDWTPIKVVNWYGREQRTVEVFSATASGTAVDCLSCLSWC